MRLGSLLFITIVLSVALGALLMWASSRVHAMERSAYVLACTMAGTHNEEVCAEFYRRWVSEGRP